MSARQKKVEPGGYTWGGPSPWLAEPRWTPVQVLFDVEYPYASSRPWLRFLYIKMAGTTLGGYKRMLSSPSSKNNIFWRRRGRGTPPPL
jgi:hypothetical protein